MEESATTSSLTAALQHYLTAANKEQLFRIPLGKTTIIGGTLTAELSSDDTGTTLIVKKPPNGFAEPKYFEPQLDTLKTQLAECGIVLEPIAEEAPKKSRRKQFFSLKPEPTNDLVAFAVRYDDEPKAIASLEAKVQEIQRNAEQKKVDETLKRVQNAIPKDMSREMAQQLVEGLVAYAKKLAAEHRVPVPKVNADDYLAHEMFAHNDSLAL